MKRVVIIGPGASGKSTLAFRLREIAELPVIELDKLFWRPGLIPTPRDEWEALQQRLAQDEHWIMDGTWVHTTSSKAGFVRRIPSFSWTSPWFAAPGEPCAARASALISGVGS